MSNSSPKAGRSWDAFCERLYAQNQFAIKLGLENMRRALQAESERLSIDLWSSHPAILVAGTNGKGSTAAFISAVLQAHGLRVGLYTSPHLIDFRERFRVNGQLLPEQLVEQIGREVLELYGVVEGTNPCLTFFESTTLMAVRLFHESKIDVGVYEIGLGGRLDAVNALEPALSVITSIDFDHGQYLGSTLEQIAREKSGIFRSDGRAVIGFQEHPEVVTELEALAPAGALFYGRDFAVQGEVSAVHLPSSFQNSSVTTRYNAETALAASRSYLAEQFDAGKAACGLERMRWPGRLDRRDVIVNSSKGGMINVTYLLDAAHNEASVRALFMHLGQKAIEPGAVVVGAMADKALEVMFAGLIALNVPVFGVEIENLRAARAGILEEAIVGTSGVTQSGGVWRGAGTCAWALEAAAHEVSVSGRVVLVFGSIYLLGEFFEWAGLSADGLLTYEDSH